MHLHLKPPYNKYTVSMCLFAVLIIYFAPLFSQINHALTSHSSSAIKMTAMENIPMTGHNHAVMALHQSDTKSRHSMGHHNHHHAKGDSINVMEACGYCSLLFHLSWLDAKSFDIIPIAQNRYPNVVTTTISRKCRLPLTPTNPRAPPIQTV